MINLSGPVQGVKKENDMFTFRVANTLVAILPRKKKLYEMCNQIKNGVWVTVKAESQFTASGEHIYDAKEINITEGLNLSPKS